MRTAFRILDMKEHEDWNRFVDQSSQGSLFHKSCWLSASGKEFRIYGYFKGGELFAGLPIACSKKLGFKIGYHPALTPYLGVVFKNSNAKYVSRISDEKEINKAIAVRLKEDFDYINIKFAPSIIDLQPFIWEGFLSGVRYTYLIKLDDLNDVWQNMDAKRRNDIARAEKDGIYVEIEEDFQQTFSLVEKTFKRQDMEMGFRTVAFKYNEILSQKQQCRSFIAKNKDGKAIATVYIVWDHKRSYYLLGGYDPELSHHGASAMAMWKSIKYTKEELGLEEFDFEGSMIPAIEQFFRKFGGRLTPYYSVKWMSQTLQVCHYAKSIVKPILHKPNLQ